MVSLWGSENRDALRLSSDLASWCVQEHETNMMQTSLLESLPESSRNWATMSSLSTSKFRISSLPSIFASRFGWKTSTKCMVNSHLTSRSFFQGSSIGWWSRVWFCSSLWMEKSCSQEPSRRRKSPKVSRIFIRFFTASERTEKLVNVKLRFSI